MSSDSIADCKFAFAKAKHQIYYACIQNQILITVLAATTGLYCE